MNAQRGHPSCPASKVISGRASAAQAGQGTIGRALRGDVIGILRGADRYVVPAPLNFGGDLG